VKILNDGDFEERRALLFEKRRALLFLRFKNYKLRPQEEGFEAVQTFFGQRGMWGSL